MQSLQQLSATNAHFCLRIEAICRRHLEIVKGSHLLIALSGGVDSTALTLILKILEPRLEIRLSALHLNHCLRPSAARDAEFARNLCQDLVIPLRLVRVNTRLLAENQGYGLEEAGRIARLDALEQQREEVGADVIVTGHQADDLAEDILLRLLRGAGWPALAGMAWRNGRLARPLLHTPKSRLQAFARELGFGWMNDESNQSLAFRRNRVRHLLMPMLRCENPAITTSLSRLHDLGRLDADYWQMTLDTALKEHPWQEKVTATGRELLLPHALLQSLHPAARLRLYHRALASLRKNVRRKGQTRMDSLLRLDAAWQEGIGGKLIQCSGGITALLKQGNVIFGQTNLSAKW